MAGSKEPPVEKQLANLLSTERANQRRAIEAHAPPPVSRRTRYACKICRDTRRVKVPRDIGRTQPCAACSDLKLASLALERRGSSFGPH